jgi:predicted MarR family transcription regulator
MSIPQDPIILLSFINTNLRDYYKTLTDLCKSLDIEENELISKLKRINYEYDPIRNQFI